ncbi:site-specific integrase [Melissococcus plutonius]|uniref:tyrosine-type recombinase/integrase n=1 Tax=Melissococcus plutonius TaxID=33970 RepID=UPI0021E52B61|nr:site-specific integrase [Melissococcus plutonius]MCV2505583.1 site-specific integrase [Melissococcus plutonius]MCV2520326.1 site-specific integrase [Melissococcus plutonius]MCV2528091.1 site-specific integrase [Melissococcus plutonius]
MLSHCYPRKYHLIEKGLLLSDYFAEFIQLYKKNTISKPAYDRYKTTLKHIKNYAPALTLGDLNHRNYQLLLNEFAKTHAYSTTKCFHVCLRQMIKYAYLDGVLDNDVAANAVIKGIRKPNQANKNYLDYNQYQSLIKFVIQRLNPANPSYAMIFLIALTGLRYAEAAALTWGDVNFIDGYIRINKSWKYKEVGQGFGSLKTLGSDRIVDLDDHTLDILNRYKLKQTAYISNLEQVQRRYTTNADNFIFFSNINKVVTNRSVNRTLKRIQKQLRIQQPITCHGLRHTYASVLLYKEIDINTISMLLGHSNDVTTRKIYLHVINELKHKNRKKIHDTLLSIYD